MGGELVAGSALRESKSRSRKGQGSSLVNAPLILCLRHRTKAAQREDRDFRGGCVFDTARGRADLLLPGNLLHFPECFRRFSERARPSQSSFGFVLIFSHVNPSLQQEWEDIRKSLAAKSPELLPWAPPALHDECNLFPQVSNLSPRRKILHSPPWFASPVL